MDLWSAVNGSLNGARLLLGSLQQHAALTHEHGGRQFSEWAHGVQAWRSGPAEPRATTGSHVARGQRRQHDKGGRRIHFRPPFCSITAANPAKQPPKLVKLSPPNGGRSTSTDGKAAPGQEPGERILVSEVEVKGVEGELRRAAEEALTMVPNRAYSVDEVKAELARVFDTGWFAMCKPETVDTRDGVKLIIQVKANPEVLGVNATGADSIPTQVIQDTFRGLHGQTLNVVGFKDAVNKLDRWYQDRGILGQVSDYSFHDGVVNVTMAEAKVNKVDLNFLDQTTNTAKVEPEGVLHRWWSNLNRTKPEVIRRHLQTAPGQVYNLHTAKQDIHAVYSTGLFEDVTIVPREADGSTEAQPLLDLTVNLHERKTGGLGAGGGISAQARGEGGGVLPGLVGSFSFNEKNLFGRNQRLSALVELGKVDKVFRLSHTDPWVNSDKHHTARTVQLLNNRTSGAAIHGGVDADEGHGAAGGTNGSGGSAGPSAAPGTVIVNKVMGGVDWRRPLGAGWSGSVGAHWQRTGLVGEHNAALLRDSYGSAVTCSGKAHDSVAMGQASVAYRHPHSESSLLLSVEQSAPVRPDWLRFSRLRLRVEKPLALVAPWLTLHLRGRAGAVLGDLPPYEAFPIGGGSSVRGYAEGGVGSARSVVEGTAELRCTLLIAPLEGTLFADYGTDLDSGATVLGDPAGARGKPGHGYGYGGGVRIASPLGPLRLEYAWNHLRQGRFHVGLGYE